MALTAHERLEVLKAFQETFGDRAGIVYEMMQPASNLATRDDVIAAVAGLATKVEVAELRTELVEVRSELRSEIHGEIGKQTRTLLFTLLTAILTSGALNSMAILLQ